MKLDNNTPILVKILFDVNTPETQSAGSLSKQINLQGIAGYGQSPQVP